HRDRISPRQDLIGTQQTQPAPQRSQRTFGSFPSVMRQFVQPPLLLHPQLAPLLQQLRRTNPQQSFDQIPRRLAMNADSLPRASLHSVLQIIQPLEPAVE